MDPILDGPPTRRPRRSGIAGLLAVLAVALGIWLVSGGDPGSSTSSEDRYADTGAATSAPLDTAAVGTDPASGLPLVALASLPPEATEVSALVERGGPFAHEEDGSTFFNYEGLLPDAETGYYREYTVDTPGSPDRGARRLVAGDDGELYYTQDHYDSFVAVRS